MKLGQKLKEARLNASMTQEELAKALGVSRQTVSSWENDRSYPDLGSTVKLSKVYGLSLDELLTEDAGVLKAFEDLVQRRRDFWQMILEIGVILELCSILLVVAEFTAFAQFISIAGFLTLNVAIVMHLRYFDHDRGQIFRGLLGLALVWGRMLLNRLIPEWGSNLFTMTLSIIPILLIWSAGVWTINWKSTRLWLIIVLYLASSFAPILAALPQQSVTQTPNPFYRTYRVGQVLYPEGSTQWKYTQVELYSHGFLLALDGANQEFNPADFTDITAASGEGVQGAWLASPEEDPASQYIVTIEADDSVVFSYRYHDQLQWKWLLVQDPYAASAIVKTFGHTTTFGITWYPDEAEGPNYTYSRKRIDVAWEATMTLSVARSEEGPLTLIEEYHHDDAVETRTYTLEPDKRGNFELELETRYKNQEQWALYRIPCGDGEYRFTLTFD